MKKWDKEAEERWETRAEELKKSHPLKVLPHLPSMPGIAPSEAPLLKWKSIYYLLKHDENQIVRRYLLKHPFQYGWRFLKSLLRKKSYQRDGDFFLYGLDSVAAFKKQIEDPHLLLAVGFSYCHKPFECPSGRFSDQCIHDENSPVCGQCFIGKAVHALPKEKTVPLFIPTVHYIGEKILELIEKHPNKKILFLITACEMTLEMFGDFGNMTGIRGIGVRLDGRICNTLKAFALSEKGVKPGLTVVLPATEERMLDLIRHLHSGTNA